MRTQVGAAAIFGVAPALIGVVVVTALIWASGGSADDAGAEGRPTSGSAFDTALQALHAQEPGLCEVRTESFVPAQLIEHGYSHRNPPPRGSLRTALDPWGFSAQDFERIEYAPDRMVIMSLDPLSQPLRGDELRRIPRAVQMELGLVVVLRGEPQWTELSLRLITPCAPDTDPS